MLQQVTQLPLQVYEMLSVLQKLCFAGEYCFAGAFIVESK